MKGLQVGRNEEMKKFMLRATGQDALNLDVILCSREFSVGSRI